MQSPDSDDDLARLEADITLPPGTPVEIGSQYIKIWRLRFALRWLFQLINLLRNGSSRPWPKNVKLVHLGGDKMGAADNIKVTPISAGQSEELALEITVTCMFIHYALLTFNSEARRNVGFWQLVGEGKRAIGDTLTVDLLGIQSQM